MASIFKIKSVSVSQARDLSVLLRAGRRQNRGRGAPWAGGCGRGMAALSWVVGVSLQRRDLPPRESPQAESDGRLQREAASVRVSSEWTGDVSQAVTVDLS